MELKRVTIVFAKDFTRMNAGISPKDGFTRSLAKSYCESVM
jgi:hypothetical protein